MLILCCFIVLVQVDFLPYKRHSETMIYGLCFCSHLVSSVDFVQHFGVNWNQNNAKSEPKGDRNASASQDRILGAPGKLFGGHFGATWSIWHAILAATGF